MSNPVKTCSVEGCERDGYLTRGMCKMHYRRFMKSGNVGSIESTRLPKSCSVEGCERKYLALGLCAMHYRRKKDHGTPGEAESRRVTDQADCKVEGCSNKADSRHLCHKHYKRWQMFGESGIERISERDPEHTVTYYGAHFRTRIRRGHASVHECVQCGDQAAEWAYRHDDPNEVVDDRGIPYSQDPSHYQPMCVSCHRNFDLNYIKTNQKLSQNAGASTISKEKK